LCIGSSLGDIFQISQREPFPVVNIVNAPNHIRYEKETYAHEAGYDAYMTGSAFIRMITHLGTQIEIQTLPATSWSLMQPFENKIYLLKLDVPLVILGKQVESSGYRLFAYNKQTTELLSSLFLLPLLLSVGYSLLSK